MRVDRFGAILSELVFDIRLHSIRWLERTALVQLGAAAAALELPTPAICRSSSNRFPPRT
jgi:hypothetical protein